MKFETPFPRFVCPGDTITTDVGEFHVTATIHHDSAMREPWKEHDGHGVISEWTNRGKRPEERILASNRAYFLYYDVAETMKIAKRDGWDAEPFGQGTPGERAARAVDADFEAMRAWCHGEWFWCFIALTVEYRGAELAGPYAASLGGVECNYPGSDNAYLTEVANELLPEAIDAAKEHLTTITA